MAGGIASGKGELIAAKGLGWVQDESATDDLMGRLKGLDEDLNKIKAQVLGGW
jgi:hypothetical protein